MLANLAMPSLFSRHLLEVLLVLHGYDRGEACGTPLLVIHNNTITKKKKKKERERFTPNTWYWPWENHNDLNYNLLSNLASKETPQYFCSTGNRAALTTCLHISGQFPQHFWHSRAIYERVVALSPEIFSSDLQQQIQLPERIHPKYALAFSFSFL
ncbi:hypothetical protein F4811DRAFT_241803 [Daldinia bambusicola]|nr:hypothetical protein F4811DRAFT_241803 [Daldinia bambusicola]